MKQLILKTPLVASSGSKICSAPYRAVLLLNEEGKALLSVEQPFKGGSWGGCGRWYLSTLLKGRDALRSSNPDALSIDYGQGWAIQSGMVAALQEACIALAENKWEDL